MINYFSAFEIAFTSVWYNEDLLTKKAVESSDEKDFLVIVDNDTAVKNLEKFAKSSNLDFKFDKKSDQEFNVYVSKSNNTEIKEPTQFCSVDNSDNTVIAISKNFMGNGSEELGKLLIKGFIYTSSKQDLSTLVEIYNVIQDFYQNLRIFTQELSSLNSSGVTPITINYQNRDSHVSYQGIIPMFLQSGGISINEEIYSVYESTIDYLNEIVPIIIPDLRLEMEAGEIEIRSDGQKIRNVSFISNRAGKRFSLKHESEGIRKIISMLGFLVEVYNKENIIAVIDELDAGVFEYLLGELIEIFSESAKGQLIFTSHNLRVLEKLPSYKVVFSTACPTNRYIRLTGIKPSNNLRDIYLRGIQLGGHEEELYQGVSNSKIKRSLRKAGMKLGK